MTTGFLIISAAPAIVAIAVAILLRKLFWARLAATLVLAIYGYAILTAQLGTLRRSVAQDGAVPSEEYRAGFDRAYTICSQQRPQIMFLFVAMTILALVPFNIRGAAPAHEPQPPPLPK